MRQSICQTRLCFFKVLLILNINGVGFIINKQSRNDQVLNKTIDYIVHTVHEREAKFTKPEQQKFHSQRFARKISYRCLRKTFIKINDAALVRSWE